MGAELVTIPGTVPRAGLTTGMREAQFSDRGSTGFSAMFVSQFHASERKAMEMNECTGRVACLFRIGRFSLQERPTHGAGQSSLFKPRFSIFVAAVFFLANPARAEKLDLTLTNWTFNAGDGGGYSIENPEAKSIVWGLATNGGVGNTGAWGVNGYGGVCLENLISPSVAISDPAPLLLEFDHSYNFEYDGTIWDGGVVDLNSNGTGFAQIQASAFTSNGYTAGILQTNSLWNIPEQLNGLRVFGGSSGGFRHSVAQLGPFNTGDTIRVRFRGGWDWGGLGTFPNWVVDNVKLHQLISPIRVLTPTNVTTSSAYLNGSLLSTGSSATAVFLVWGSSDGGTNWSGWSNTNTWAAPRTAGSFSYLASPLAGDTGYYCRFASTNAAGPEWANSSLFFMTGELKVQATDDQAQFPSDAGTFTVSRPAACTNGALTVYYTLSGSATNGIHYRSLSGVATIAEGATSTAVTVTSTPDGAGTVTLTLAAGGYRIGSGGSATVTINAYSGWKYAVCVVPPGYPGHMGPTVPYNTWATAFTNLQAAFDYAGNGYTIYAAGGQTLTGPGLGTMHPSNTVFLWHDAANVALRGGYDASTSLAPGAHPGPRTAGPTILTRATTNAARILTMAGVSNAVVEQIAVQGGYCVGIDFQPFGGGGVHLGGCRAVTFADSLIVSNSANARGSAAGMTAISKGGGMAVQDSDVMVTNTTIGPNMSTDTWSPTNVTCYGGGVFIALDGRMAVMRSVLQSNELNRAAKGSKLGAGFFVDAGGELGLYESVLRGNVASDPGVSIGYGSAGLNVGTLNMRNCLVVGNQGTTNACDGIYGYDGVAMLVNCTVAGNNRVGLGYRAGTFSLTNCIVWGHSMADLYRFPTNSIGKLSNVGYSTFGISLAASGSNTTAAMSGVNGCKTNNPLFKGANDYRLRAVSPAVDAGFNGLSGWMLGATDLDGSGRRQRSAIDMGAYELSEGFMLSIW